MKLHSRIHGLTLPEPKILRIADSPERPDEVKALEALVVHRPSETINDGFGLVLSRSGEGRFPQLPPEINYVQTGDIIRVSTNGEISVIYRKTSRFNAMLVTERCNSKCLMCSQPPKAINDDFLIEDWLKAIPLMSQDTPELGITGGEPTLRFHDLLDLIHSVRQHLPATALHMLSNGRLFSYLKYAQKIADLAHPDFMIGIPLYSDLPDAHDFVVQARDAFKQTVLGILNLARLQQKIEIRFVLHRLTYERLPQFARFVARNLPFVDHVALMGLEIMGYTRSNLEALWVDPVDYQKQLEAAVGELIWAGVPVSIYNLPLCLLPKSLWNYSRQSISDWKNIYFDECQRCAVKPFCAGFFASAEVKRSKHIRSLGTSEREYASGIFDAPSGDPSTSECGQATAV
jgi:His-Xaa-Ser system radical SAM maturase HxsC